MDDYDPDVVHEVVSRLVQNQDESCGSECEFLELGAGTGIKTRHLVKSSRLPKNRTFLASEPMPDFLKPLRAKIPNVRAIQFAAGSIPLPDYSVQTRVCLHKVTDPKAFLTGVNAQTKVKYTKESLLGRIATIGSIVRLPEQEKSEALRDIRDFLDNNPETSTQESFAVPILIDIAHYIKVELLKFILAEQLIENIEFSSYRRSEIQDLREYQRNSHLYKLI